MEAGSIVTVSGNKMYLNPLLGFGLKENPFKNPDRKFDVELGTPRNRIYSMVYKLPPGYKVEEAPKSAKMIFGENKALVFEYYVEAGPESIKITVRDYIKQPYIPVALYPDLQQFYGTIVSKYAEQIVLTKL